MTRNVLLVLAAAAAAAGTAADWPQWRGPDRSNVSAETGLLAEWPAGGPPLLWAAKGLGEGVPSVAVAGGKVFTLGYRDDTEYVTAVGEADGKVLWSTPIGPAVKELPSMRWLSQRAPTVDGDRVYGFSVRGILVCLSTADGKERWRKNYVTDFGGKPGGWGYCDYPLVDGDRLICTPGVAAAALVALDKKTGELAWKCPVSTSPRGTYSAAVVAEIAGTRQYVQQLETGVVGVSTDGRLLWTYPNFGGSLGNVHTALVRGDEVFVSCGWNVGAALLKVAKDGDRFAVAEVWRSKEPKFDAWIGSPVRIGDYVHASNRFAVEWKTGKVVASPAPLAPTGRVTMTAAGGRLIHRTGNGVVTLAGVAADGTYAAKGELKEGRVSKEPAWTTPVVANGRLYLRDQDELRCYDLRANAGGAKRRPPDVIFVPTPQDVVEKMLDLAKVAKADVVADLGCGDGRIVVTAAKTYGCKAVGYDLDPECVKLSRAAVEKAGVGKLVRVEEADVLEADLTGVTVITLYVGVALNAKLVPRVEKLPAGARVVSHQFPIPGLKPDRVVRVTSAEDGVERPVYLYTVPFTREKAGAR
jgi:outer membrane protein assembly factor BamB